MSPIRLSEVPILSFQSERIFPKRLEMNDNVLVAGRLSKPIGGKLEILADPSTLEGGILKIISGRGWTISAKINNIDVSVSGEIVLRLRQGMVVEVGDGYYRGVYTGLSKDVVKSLY